MKSINLSFAQIMILTVSCLVLGMISVGYVAAQTASSTEEAATSTPVIESAAEPEAVVLGEATTTEATATEEAAPEAEEQEEPEVVVEEEISAAEASVGEITALEQEYMSKYGRYLQVMLGNTLPTYESGSVESKFGKAIPENVRIDVYQSPHGKGYQISYEEDGVVHSVGYGPEAGDRTYTIELPVPVSATSTPEVL